MRKQIETKSHRNGEMKCAENRASSTSSARLISPFLESSVSSTLHRTAFSLIELLVVIGIIGILIGMLLPAIQRARSSAYSTQCAAQLRSVGQALAVYVNNNRGYFPGWSGWQVANGNGTGDDEVGLGWTEVLGGELNPLRSRIWNCPTFPEQFRINYFMSARYSYLCGRTHLRYGEIRLGPQFVLSGDCTQQLLYPPTFGTAPFTSDDCDKDDATQEGVVFANQPGGLSMHKGGNNVLFGDWHVELIPRFERGRLTYNPHRIEAWADVTPN
jgi:prepilin-type N-terminal cleavage/methylation domain-containing protein/prepilin-type processing-associated H-X9-DG protein